MDSNIERRTVVKGAVVLAMSSALGLKMATSAQAHEGDFKGDLAEVTGGSRDSLRVVLQHGNGDELTLPTRGFSDDWKFEAGDIVHVTPGSFADGITVAEPFLKVIQVEDALEVWTTNTNVGPRLAAVSQAR